MCVSIYIYKPIWGWSSGWFGILEFAPLKISGSIPSNTNFGSKSIQCFTLALNGASASGWLEFAGVIKLWRVYNIVITFLGCFSDTTPQFKTIATLNKLEFVII